MTSQSSRPFPDGTWALDLLWVGLLAMYAFAGYPVVPFHGDESMQIFMSYDYAYLVQDRNLNTLVYDPEMSLLEDVEQGLRILNGTINKYTIGLAWDVGGFSREDLNWPWFWDESYAFNMNNGFYPGDDLLLVARVPSALFLGGAVVLLFYAIRAFAGRPAAYVGTAYFALSPAVLANGRRAMMEGSLLFGAALVLLAGLLLVQSAGWRAWGAALLLGFGAGLAVSSKHTNVIAVIAVFLGAGLYALSLMRARRGRAWRLLAQLMLAGVFSLGVFLLFNQAYWGNPVQVARVVLDERVSLLDGQVDTFGGYGGPLSQVVGFYREVFDGRPMYNEAQSFEEAIQPQIYTYEQTPYAGVYLPGSGIVILVLFCLGLAVVFGRLHLPNIAPGTRWIVGSYSVIHMLFLLTSVPLPWQRYYLPAFPMVALVAPLGVVWLVRLYLRDAAENSPQYKKGSARVQRSS